jgi:hypothetical protein
MTDNYAPTEYIETTKGGISAANLAIKASKSEEKSIEIPEMILLRMKITTDLEKNIVTNHVGNIPVISDVKKIKEDIFNAIDIPDYYEKVKSIEEMELAAAAAVEGFPAPLKRKLEEIRQG